MRFAAILFVCLVALAALAASEHARPNAGLPVVKTAAPRGTIAFNLNTTCVLTPMNPAPPRKEIV